MAEQIKKLIQLPKLQYYETHLSIINPILPEKMTPMEIRVLAAFMALEGDIAKDRFGSTARKIVRSQLNLSVGGLSNYISTLSKRENFKFLIKDGDNISIRPILFPEKTEQLYMFKLVNQG